MFICIYLWLLCMDYGGVSNVGVICVLVWGLVAGKEFVGGEKSVCV